MAHHNLLPGIEVFFNVCALLAAWSTTKLRILALNQTGISGTLPPDWGSNTTASSLGSSLQELYLHQTQIYGEIPATWLMGLPNVTKFTVWRTEVCGKHPEGGVGLGALCMDTAGTRLGEQGCSLHSSVASCLNSCSYMHMRHSTGGLASAAGSPGNHTRHEGNSFCLSATIANVCVTHVGAAHRAWCMSYIWVCAAHCYAGMNCSQPWMGPIVTVQQPMSCISQFPAAQYPGCSGIPCSDAPSKCCANVNDKTYLWSLRNALGTPPFLDSWTKFEMPCGSPRWEWIDCTWDGSVYALNFSGMGISGTLPPDLVMVNGLQVLDLSRNNISGTLPVVTTQNPYIKVIDLSFNMLNGGLPDSWSQLTSLNSLDLSNNPIGVSRSSTPACICMHCTA